MSNRASRSKMHQLHLGFVVLLWLFSPYAQAQLNWTNFTGGPGGSAGKNAECGGRVIVGIEARSGVVVDQLRLLCRSITASGATANDLQRTNWVGGSGGVTTRKLECPANHMVVKIQAGTVQYGPMKVMGGLRIFCHNSDNTHTARGSGVKKEFSLGNVTWSDLRRCGRTSNVPRRGLGQAIRVAYGAVVDKVALGCSRMGRQVSGGPDNNTGNTGGGQAPAAPWGWSNSFTADDVEEYRLPRHMIGKSMKDIVQGNSVVRRDGRRCKDCHMYGESKGEVSWEEISSAANSSELNALCDQDSDDNNRVDFQYGFQYAWGKPTNLKKLFWHWHYYGCRK